MRPRIVALWIVLLGSWLVVGCASSPRTSDPAASTAPETETWGKVDQQDLEYPGRIGSFSLKGVKDYDEVELGVALRYSDSTRPRATIDVYVYPISKPSTLSLTHVLEWGMASLSQGMEYVARQNGLKAGDPRFFFHGPSSENPRRGLGVFRTLSSPNGELASQGYLVVRDHRFFKLRMTIPRQNSEREADDYFQEVIDVLQPAIRLRAPVEQPDLGITLYQNVIDARKDGTCNLGLWLLYGASMLKEIEAGNYLDSFQREFAARKRVLDHWRGLRDKGRPCPSGILELTSRVDEAGFLAEYVFEAYGRGRWPLPANLHLEEWKKWSRSNVEAHDPVVEPGVGIEWRATGDAPTNRPERASP